MDQQTLKSSIPFAITAIAEFTLRRQPWKAPFTRLSVLYQYYFARNAAKLQTTDDVGLSVTNGMVGLMAYALVAEDVWPFDPAKINEEPPQDVRDQMIEFATIDVRDVWDGVDGPMRNMADNKPILFRFVGPPEMIREAGKTGKMRAWGGAPPADRTKAGHAMVVVGYDLASQSLLIRNSFGADWGDGGHFTMPLDTYHATACNMVSFAEIVVEETAGLRPRTGFGTERFQATQELTALRSSLRGELQGDLDAAKKSIRDRLRGA
jgi:hypothetical protein